MGRPAPRSHYQRARESAANGGRGYEAPHTRNDGNMVRERSVAREDFHALDPVQADARPSAQNHSPLPLLERALHLDCVKLTEERLPLGVAYPRLLDVVHRVVPFDHGTLYLAEVPAGSLIPAAVRGNRVDLADQIRFAKGSGVSAWVAQEARPIIIPHPVQSTDLSPFADKGMRAFLAVPLIHKGGVTGVITLTRAEEMFTEEEFTQLVHSGERLAATLTRLQLQSRYRNWVSIDPKTGLSARPHFLARLEAELARARDHATEFAVVVIVLEGLETGSVFARGKAHKRLIRDFATRLQTGIRSCDTAAHLDDTKFGILLAGVNRETAGTILQRIATTVLHGPPGLVQGEHPVRLCGGVAAFPEAGSSADGLVQQAGSGLKLIA